MAEDKFQTVSNTERSYGEVTIPDTPLVSGQTSVEEDAKSPEEIFAEAAEAPKSRKSKSKSDEEE